MPFENSFFFVNDLRREKDMYHFKLKTITKGILNLHTSLLHDITTTTIVSFC